MKTYPSRPKYITADTLISDSPVTIAGIILTGGSDQAQVIVYDENDDDKTAGQKALSIKAAANTTVVTDISMYLKEGCYIDISGTSPEATIFVK